MSYPTAAREPLRARSPRLLAARRAPVQGAQLERPGEVDSAYVESGRALGKAVKKIHQYAAEIQRARHVFVTGHSSTGSKKNVQEAGRLAKATVEEAKRLLGRFPAGVEDSVHEQNRRCLAQEKLHGEVLRASEALERELRAYNAAEAERTGRDAANAAVEGTAGSCDREMQDPEAQDARPGLQEMQEADITEAAEFHAATVEEYAQDVATMASEISDLNCTILDLQGIQLDTIESNMARTSEATGNLTEQLVQASHHQSAGTEMTEMLMWTRLVAVAIAIMLVIVLGLRN